MESTISGQPTEQSVWTPAPKSTESVEQIADLVRQDPNRILEFRNLGLRFYVNPNHAFTFKGMYRSFFEKKLYMDSLQEKGVSLYRWIWRDLNLSIGNGDIVAIMGANGEGKTTLLRVLAGLLNADEGTIVSRYKPFLLSAGIGFREELSGYENIMLGGLYLGVPADEMRDLTPKVAEFAELKHQDLLKPFKYYSDGMRARLVFSVATCTPRKMLFLDEILGAGDIGFQKKSAQRMNELMASASTIVIVSHNIGFVRSSATKALLLHGGKIVDFGPVNRIVDEYEKVCSR